jgi:hypothetical protein
VGISSFPHFGQSNDLYDIFSQPPLEDFLRIEPLLANCKSRFFCSVNMRVDSGFGFFAVFVHLGFCLGGGFFGLMFPVGFLFVFRCFPSFWFSGKGFRGFGKGFDGHGKLCLWLK